MTKKEGIFTRKDTLLTFTTQVPYNITLRVQEICRAKNLKTYCRYRNKFFIF